MSITTFDADTFKGVACAVDPYLREITYLREVPDQTDREAVYDCTKSISDILERGGSELEVFCRDTSAHLLWGVCEFCQYKWVELRFRELGLV